MSGADAERVAVIDFEASCLPAFGPSYPIEVALVAVDGEVLVSALIQPHPTWSGMAWDPAAERLHGVSRDQLAAEGRPAFEVIMDLNHAARGMRVVSDSGLDEVWLQRLYAATGVPAAFDIAPIGELLAPEVAGAPGPDPIADAAECAYFRFPRMHRATPDAQRLAETVRLARTAASFTSLSARP
ncbi:MAG: hypothetical protein V4466_00300 [Pseudomonadota bacterium]